jgi:hypothetical protein
MFDLSTHATKDDLDMSLGRFGLGVLEPQMMIFSKLESERNEQSRRSIVISTCRKPMFATMLHIHDLWSLHVVLALLVLFLNALASLSNHLSSKFYAPMLKLFKSSSH